MNKFIDYYQKNVCPFCLKYQLNICDNKIIQEADKDINSILCHNYQRNYDIEEIKREDIIEEGFKPIKYYRKNYKEV